MFHKGMTGRTDENGPASVKNDIGKRGGQDLYLRDYITRKQESDTFFTEENTISQNSSDELLRLHAEVEALRMERAALAEQAVPVAWMDPATLDVIHAERRRAWRENYGHGGRSKAATYTVPLYAAPPAPARQEPLTDAARDVLTERQRQVSAEGWTARASPFEPPVRLAEDATERTV